MGKVIQFNLDGQQLSVELEKKIYREDLYGKVTTLAEQDGRALKKCYLRPDGTSILRSQLSSVKVDPLGTPVEEAEHFLGEEKLAMEEGSFDTTREMTRVDWEALTAFSCSDVYELSSPAAALTPGVYATTFSYRKGYLPWQDALVVIKPDMAFLLIGSQHAVSYVGRTATYAFFDSQEDGETEESDLLDFSL